MLTYVQETGKETRMLTGDITLLKYYQRPAKEAHFDLLNVCALEILFRVLVLPDMLALALQSLMQ